MSERDGQVNGHVPNDPGDGKLLEPGQGTSRHRGRIGRSAGHPEIEERLAALTAGELAPMERQQVLAHLAGCDVCAAALADVQRIRGLLRTLEDRAPAHPGMTAEVPASLADAVVARLDAPGATWEDDPANWLAPVNESADAASRPEQSARPVSDAAGVLSPDFRPLAPRSDGRPSERDRWWQRTGGSEGEQAGMDQHRSRLVTDAQPVAPQGALPTRTHATQVPVRRRALPALAATAALILVSAALFGALRARTSGLAGGAPTTPATPATPTTGASGTAVVPFPPIFAINGRLASVAMRSPDDGWAVGSQTGVGSLILHFDGRHWVRSNDAFPGVTLVMLNSVAVDPAGGAWAVGEMSDHTTGVVLRYAGGHWSAVTTPLQHFNGMKVQAVSADEAWVLVGLGKGQTGWLSTALLHERNGSWSVVSVSASLTDIAMSADGTGWATSADGSILRYQDGAWSVAATTPDGQPLALRMFSATDGWVVGFTNSTARGMFLMHYDGAHWTRVQGPPAAGPSNLFTIDGVSSGDVWAGGDDGHVTVMLHYVGGQWQRVKLNFAGSIRGIAMVSSTEGWAVAGGTSNAPVVLHYANGTWTGYVEYVGNVEPAKP